MGLGHNIQIRPASSRLEVGLRGVVAAASLDGSLIGADAVLLGAVYVGIIRNPDLDAGVDEGFGQRMGRGPPLKLDSSVDRPCQ